MFEAILPNIGADMKSQEVAEAINALIYAVRRNMLSQSGFRVTAGILIRKLGVPHSRARHSKAARAALEADEKAAVIREHVIPVSEIMGYMLTPAFKPFRVCRTMIKLENFAADMTKSAAMRARAAAMCNRIRDDAILHVEIELNDLIWIAIVTKQEDSYLNMEIHGASLKQRMPKQPWKRDGNVYDRYAARGIEMEDILPATLMKASALRE